VFHASPKPRGLYDPGYEHDSCGVAFVVDLQGRQQHELVQYGIQSLCHLQHRGASGSEVNTGDGAGILIQVPDRFFREVADFPLPPKGTYATGIGFLPRETEQTTLAIEAIGKIAASEGLAVLGWRDLPYDDSMIGQTASAVKPCFRQLFVAADEQHATPLAGMRLERRAFILRKRIEREVENVYFPSLSSRTIVYKGMLTSDQLPEFFLDLTDERVESALALVHSRFSTNTFPSWPLAHPYRYISHNGEINTVKGNRNWMRAREALFVSDLLPGNLERIYPILTEDASDSASFDEALELLHMGGRPLAHAVLMMIPEAWENHASMSPERRAFYEYHASLMEPWDGPASIAFTDGTVIGALLDRNGLRPSRYWVTDNDLVIFGSEVGLLNISQEQIVRKGRLQPGRIFLVDTVQGRIIDDDEIKKHFITEHPYQAWLDSGQKTLDDLPSHPPAPPSSSPLLLRQQVFGYTLEDLSILLGPMSVRGMGPIGSMGTDTPLAVLSNRPRLLYDYFKQLFAQVTNPPLDAIREELVTSLRAKIGPENNLLQPTATSCRQISLATPVIDNSQLAKLRHIEENDLGPQPAGQTDGFRSVTIEGCFDTTKEDQGLQVALANACAHADNAITAGANIIILSDRHCDKTHAPIPALLLTSAVHHHLIRKRLRTKTSLVIETGEAREIHHICLLIGYGANAVNPYLALETIEDMVETGQLENLTTKEAQRNYIKACGKGILKVMSKMGISTVASYTGAQVFEAIGLDKSLVKTHFTGTTSQIGGIDLDTLAQETTQRHRRAFLDNPAQQAHRGLDIGGEYQWRQEGEHHLFNPETVHRLQHATRTKQYQIFKEYTELIDNQAERLGTLRGLFEFRHIRPPVPLEEVESAAEIMKRFSTGAMSYGSISAEAHETLAIAMNRIAAKSNTGEGGENPDRFTPDENGDLRRSAIKQVASGRFGVTSEYLTNADDIQIKMAQGAKPGEGGQLPGKKVWPWIASTRYSTPGVGLISPPPHHDIYSIEDLAQLIHDLKNANPKARIHVKLVSEVGVGTVAAGVSKAHADVVLISGYDGGTGASPLSSLKHAGTPWELGLAETQQTLLLNDLRDRIVVQTDGQLKTGRDVMIAALLGAEEFCFATAPLVVSGCVMMRVCHLDTCPVGIATQKPELRTRFTGKPEFVVTFFEYIAAEIRELLASLGFRSLGEAIGHTETLDTNKSIAHWKASGLDLSPIFEMPDIAEGKARHCTTVQDHGLDKALDNTLIQLAEPAIERKEAVQIDIPIQNVNRTAGTMLGWEVTKKHGATGLPENTIRINCRGSAGQSFGAFLPKGITMRLEGDANDYFGKGLSGGKVIVHRDRLAVFPAEKNIIAGNVILYGATGGECYIEGVVGERFCVRNSGAIAVVEGIGDHGCEYMTGGKAVILGETGRNFGAGMSGGIAYIYDPHDTFPSQVNREMVDLDPLEETDVDWLRQTLQTHVDWTGSTVGTRLLSNWDIEVDLFLKVMPKDYKRVLNAMATAEQRGISVDEAVMEASHG